MTDLEALKRLHKYLIIYVNGWKNKATPHLLKNGYVDFEVLNIKSKTGDYINNYRFSVEHNTRTGDIWIDLPTGSLFCYLCSDDVFYSSPVNVPAPVKFLISMKYKDYYITKMENSIEFYKIINDYGDLYIDTDLVLTLPLEEFMHQGTDDMFQYSVLVPNYEEIHPVFHYAVLHGINVSFNRSDIIALGELFETECKRRYFV